MSLADIDKVCKIFQKPNVKSEFAQATKLVAIAKWMDKRCTALDLDDADFDLARSLLVKGGVRCYLDADYVKARNNFIVGFNTFMSDGSPNKREQLFLYLVYFVILVLVASSSALITNATASSLSDIGVPPVVAQRFKLFSKCYLECMDGTNWQENANLTNMLNIWLKRTARLFNADDGWK